MDKKLSTQGIQTIDAAFQGLERAWASLKATWANSNDTHELDPAFYRFVEVWLATDNTVDRVTHAHALTYWTDPELEPVREAVREVQTKLAKLDDPQRKQRDVERLQALLRDFAVG